MVSLWVVSMRTLGHNSWRVYAPACRTPRWSHIIFHKSCSPTVLLGTSTKFTCSSIGQVYYKGADLTRYVQLGSHYVAAGPLVGRGLPNLAANRDAVVRH